VLPPSPFWLLWTSRTVVVDRDKASCSVQVLPPSPRGSIYPCQLVECSINCIISLADSDRTVILIYWRKKIRSRVVRASNVLKTSLGYRCEFRLCGWRPVSLTVDLSHPSNTNGFFFKMCSCVWASNVCTESQSSMSLIDQTVIKMIGTGISIDLWHRCYSRSTSSIRRCGLSDLGHDGPQIGGSCIDLVFISITHFCPNSVSPDNGRKY